MATDTSTAGARGSGSSPRPAPKRSNVVARLFSSVSLFVAQILDELRKVVRPTRHELTTYTTVVIVFVVLVMGFVFGLDFGFGKLVLFVFGGG